MPQTGESMAAFLSAPEIGTGGAKSLPGRYYTSEEVFRLERERIFSWRWLCVCRGEDLAEAGDFVVRDCAGESVIVCRDRAGRIRAFFNVCRHRGTRLCEAQRGRFGNAITCPYHAWTYGLDGSLKGAPSMQGGEGFDAADYGLIPANVAEWEGFVFLSLAADPDPFETSHAPVLSRFSRYNLASLRTVRTIHYDVRANWKLLFENYSECYHCGPVHPSLVKLSPADSGANDLTSGPFLGGYMEVTGGESMTLSGRACAIPVADLPDVDVRRVYYYALFPNMLLSLHPDYVMAHLLWPEAVGRTRIECRWLFHPAAAAQPGFDPDDGVNFWDRTNREDWHICEQSQLGVSSRAYIPGPYSPRESISAAFDREVLAALDETDP